MLEMGGEKLVSKHKEKGKLTARERLGVLFDEGNLSAR
jgi:acetyl-CoA carboxylase carboxyltransferase component